MELLSTTWLIAAATALVFYYLLTRRDKSYPPGPLAFPFIGNLPQLMWTGTLPKFTERYRKQYGNVYSFEMNGIQRVVISGYDAIRTLLVKNADYSSNRSDGTLSKYFKNVVKDYPGLVWAPFPHWKTIRSFAINTLREEGMGKAAFEPRILEEVESYIDYFVKPNLGKPFCMRDNLSQATSNLISQMLYARRFGYDDEEFNTLAAAIDEAGVVGGKIMKLESLPFSSFLIKSAIERQKYLHDKIEIPTIQSYIDESKRRVDEGNPQSLIDRFVIHSKTADQDSEKYFSDKNGIRVALHLYIAGTETTATALRWALLFMCLHPDVKKKVQEEIDDVIGPTRGVSCKDRINMPYTDAVLFETLRKGNLTPVTLPHDADVDLEIDGVRIPAGANLMIDITSVLYDETVFEDREKFKPERYLTGDIALKKQRTIPFGIGRRVCPGESLAKAEFFIFFVTFLQRYDITLPEGSAVTDERDPGSGLINGPQRHDLIFTARH